MKQVLQNLKTGQTSIVDVPIPTPKPGQAVIRNAASLVSAGTERMLVDFAGKNLLGKARSRPDLVRQVLDKARREGLITTAEAALNRLDQPMPLGYSSAGVIVKLGQGMSGFNVGQRVACSGGGYAVHAEYVSVPANLLTPLPDNVSFEEAAFTTLGAIALHGFRLAETQLGENVAVIGLGILGLLTLELVRAAGCHALGIDIDAHRVSLGNEMGAYSILRENAEDASEGFTNGRGFDAVLICADSSSTDPVELAGTIARDRARIIAVGAVGQELPRKIYYEKELTFLNSRSYGPGRYDPEYEEGGQDYPIGYVRWTEGRNLESFVDLLSRGKINVQPLITHRFPIEDAPQAYELITGNEDQPFVGVVLTYQDQEDAVDQQSSLAASRISYSQSIHHEGKETKTVRLGVLGAGNFAQAVMLPNLKKVQGIELVGISSTSGVGASHAAKRYGFEYACSDEDQIIRDSTVNTVAILTRHDLHAAQVIKALSDGKNVFCKKPLALNEEELAGIVETLKNDAPLLTVGFNRRFAPLAIQMKEFLEVRSDAIAAHYRINAGYIPLKHWTQDPTIGGGRIIGEGCHFVDFLTFLIGMPPLTVHTTALPDTGRYNEDNVVMTFSFPDGSIGTVSYLANGDKAFPKERVEVFSSGHVAVLDDFRKLETFRNSRRKTYRSRLRQDKGHLGEWESFRDAILQKGPPPIQYTDLFGVTRATFAAIRSLRIGETVSIE